MTTGSESGRKKREKPTTKVHFTLVLELLWKRSRRENKMPYWFLLPCAVYFTTGIQSIPSQFNKSLPDAYSDQEPLRQVSYCS
jgi:hypothetical protein